MLRVQGDLRYLPFSKQFDTIIVLGAVTAYLMDDNALAEAARSLRTAMVSAPSARLLIDAYDRETIHQTDYFRGRGEWGHEGERYTHTIRSESLLRNGGTFRAELNLANVRAPNIYRHTYHFHQRAFSSNELQQVFGRAGWRLVTERSDCAQGRLFHTYELR